MKQEALQKISEKISKKQKEISDLKERIFGSNICPITHCEITNPVIVPCCKNKFELTSLTEYFQFQKNKSKPQCPMCRCKFDINKMIHIDNDENK